MNKSDLIDHVADRAGLTRAQASEAVDAVVGAVSDTLGKGEDVAIPGFGKFSVSQRQAREGVKPGTSEKIQIPASKAPKFTAGSKLKEAVNK